MSHHGRVGRILEDAITIRINMRSKKVMIRMFTIRTVRGVFTSVKLAVKRDDEDPKLLLHAATQNFL